MDNVHVTQVKRVETDGYLALQIGAGEPKLKNVKKPQLFHCLNNEIPPKRKFVEFR